MSTLLDYLFVEPFPLTWLVQDAIAILLSLLVLATIIRREKQPMIAILEAFAFVMLYASVYENAACVMGLYSYGRSLLMIGYVPFSVPLIEVCVLITGFWFLEKTGVPTWTRPIIIGLFGMLQDFSLDPLAIRQIGTVGEVVSGRWNWLIAPTDPNILNVPVFNFPGWMLIMLYGAACILAGRWVYRRSGGKAWVGVVYPFVALFAALLLMISPISRFLLWLEPIFQKGSAGEWIALIAWLIGPSVLLAVYWRGRMTRPFTQDDLPIFLVPAVLHGMDILFALIGGFGEILGIVLLASAVHLGFLGFAYLRNRPDAIRPETTRPALA